EGKGPVAPGHGSWESSVVMTNVPQILFSGGLAMRQLFMVGCDLHDQSMLLMVARGRESAQRISVKNDSAGRIQMISKLKALAEGSEVIFVYEASGQGFGLHDQLTAAGIQCFVLAPTK